MSSSTTIRDAVAAASAYLSEHPDAARYRDSHARARLGTDLAVDVDGPGGERLRTDMPRGIGGTAKSPSPGWYFRAATASCVAALIGIRAATLGVTLGPVEVVVDSESDDRGILGLDDTIHAGPLSTRVVVRLEATDVDRAQLDAIVSWAMDHCPVTDAVRRSIPLEVVQG
jgi:uncharacterized OsmC-like protein